MLELARFSNAVERGRGLSISILRNIRAKNLPAGIGIVVNGFYLICVAIFVIGLAHNHMQLISHEHPLDYNEAGMLAITSTIAHGDNPYSFESQPIRISLYPALYNIVVAPISRVVGNTLPLHRALAGLFILGTCALCYYLCRKSSGTRSESFVAAALVYAGLLFYSTPIASPNGLGLLLFMSAIAIPWVNGFSTRGLAVSILFGILAFYTKQYFIACLGYVAVYLFIAESKRRAIYFSLAALIVFITVLAVVCYTSPYYLEDTFFAVRSSAKLYASGAYAFEQLMKLIQIYLPLLVIPVIAIGHQYLLNRSAAAQHGGDFSTSASVNLLDLDKPLVVRKLNYIWVCCTCSLIVIALVLGKNVGNHLTYLFQLISPFLLVGIFALISAMPKWQLPFRLLIVIALYNSYAMLSTDFSVQQESWHMVRKEIAEADDIYGSTLVLQEVMEKDAAVYDNGHTRYFIFSRDAPPLFVKSNREHTVQAVWERYVNLIQTKIRNQEFDLLLIDRHMHLPFSEQHPETEIKALLKSHYKQTALINLPLLRRPGAGNFPLQIWKPIRPIPNANAPHVR